MNGIENFLGYISENWVAILVLFGLTLALGRMVYNYLKIDNVEKIEIAKTQIREAMLKLITEAEIDFEEWNKSGKIKRSQVITKEATPQLRESHQTRCALVETAQV